MSPLLSHPDSSEIHYQDSGCSDMPDQRSLARVDVQAMKWVFRRHPLTRGIYVSLAYKWCWAKIFLYQKLFGRYFTSRYFDHFFAATPDPWGFREGAIAQERRRLIIGLLSRRRYSRLLEIGCAEGWMTLMLANLADEVVSVDLSVVALERARKQCSDLRNVTFEQMDLIVDPLPVGLFDCILCAGVLEYLPMNVQQNVCQKIVASLPCGGELLLEHPRKRFPGEVAGARSAFAVSKKS